jgi:hypothetical protein
MLLIISAGSFATVFAQSSIQISSDKDVYKPGDTVKLFGTANGAEKVAIEIQNSSGTPIFLRTVSPDASGKFTISFKVPEDFETGSIKIISTASIADQIMTQTKNISVSQTLTPNTESGGCLIATATYGTELAPQVQQLRELRDNHLLQSESGKSFMEPFNHIYYSFSPTIADWERQNPFFKEAVKITITPMISSLSLLNHVSMDSEAEVIVYGTSLILLNLGMYIGVPAAIITSLRKSVI